jgi:hypothetical protein
MAVAWTQTSARFRADDGSESAATWLFNAGANGTVSVGNGGYNLRVRIQARETGTTASTLTGRLYIQKNGLATVQIGTAAGTAGAYALNSDNLTDDGTTTPQIGSAGTSFVSGRVDDVNGQCTATGTITQNKYTEHEYMVKIDWGNVVQGTYIDFRERASTTAFGTYTFVPRMTVQYVAQATSSTTDDNDTLSSTGTVAFPEIHGDASLTEEGDTCSGIGTVGAAVCTGTANITQASDTVSGVGISNFGTVVDIDHETGTIATLYTGSALDGGDVSIDAAAGLAGTGKGLNVLIDDVNSKYVYKNLRKNYPYLRCRFYFDPNSVSFVSDFSLAYVQQFEGDWAMSILLKMNWSGSAYRLYTVVFEDGGSSHLGAYKTITDAPHYIEFCLTRATTNSSNDGIFQWWIDGVLQETVTALDCYNVISLYTPALLFSANDLSGTPSGTIFFDEIIVNNTGIEIGPKAGGTTSTGTANLTQEADSLSALGGVTAKGTANIAEASDTISGSGVTPHSGIFSQNQAAQTVSGVGNVLSKGILSVTEQADSLSGLGGVTAKGTASVTEASDTLSGSGTIGNAPDYGNASIAQANQTLSGLGQATSKGIANITQSADSVSGSGTATIKGNASIVQANNTIVSSGAILSLGNASIAQASQTVLGTGTLQAITYGNASITQANNTIVGLVTHVVVGIFSQTQENEIASGSATALIKGVLSQAQNNQTVSGTGSALSAILGTLNIAQAAIVLIGSGMVFTPPSSPTKSLFTVNGKKQKISDEDALVIKDKKHVTDIRLNLAIRK